MLSCGTQCGGARKGEDGAGWCGYDEDEPPVVAPLVPLVADRSLLSRGSSVATSTPSRGSSSAVRRGSALKNHHHHGRLSTTCDLFEESFEEIVDSWKPVSSGETVELGNVRKHVSGPEVLRHRKQQQQAPRPVPQSDAAPLEGPETGAAAADTGECDSTWGECQCCGKVLSNDVMVCPRCGEKRRAAGPASQSGFEVLWTEDAKWDANTIYAEKLPPTNGKYFFIDVEGAPPAFVFPKKGKPLRVEQWRNGAILWIGNVVLEKGPGDMNGKGPRLPKISFGCRLPEGTAAEGQWEVGDILFVLGVHFDVVNYKSTSLNVNLDGLESQSGRLVFNTEEVDKEMEEVFVHSWQITQLKLEQAAEKGMSNVNTSATVEGIIKPRQAALLRMNSGSMEDSALTLPFVSRTQETAIDSTVSVISTSSLPARTDPGTSSVLAAKGATRPPHFWAPK